MKEKKVAYFRTNCHPNNDGMVKRFALSAVQDLRCPLHKNLHCTCYTKWTTLCAMTLEDGTFSN